MITGMYQTSIGAHHHRSHRADGYRLPEPVRLITDYLRDAGYFTANVKTAAAGVRGSGKTDFNFSFEDAFDNGDWNERKPGQPFFAQLSISVTHRGAHWETIGEELETRVNPAEIELPPYYPDHPIARADWATYLDSIQVMDGYVGKVLKRLDDEGLANNTVVIFIGDHGRCHVRGKQWLYDGGIHIPMIIRWPGKLKAGEIGDDLVSAIDRIRCVRTKRYKYIRNFMPERPYTQKNAYKERRYPMLRLMKELHSKGELTPAQALFMSSQKPGEELYDIRNDPWEIHNLAGSPEHQSTLEELGRILETWIEKTGDRGRFREKASALSERDWKRIKEMKENWPLFPEIHEKN